MDRDRTSQVTREAARQGLLQLVLLTAALVLVNRLMRGFAWDVSLWRSLQFAVPFTLLFAAFQVVVQRQRDGRG